MTKAIAKLLIALCLFVSATEGLESLSGSHKHPQDAGYFIPVSTEHAAVFAEDVYPPTETTDCQEEAHQCHPGHCGALANSASQVPLPNSFESLQLTSDSLLGSAYLDMAGDPPRGRT